MAAPAAPNPILVNVPTAVQATPFGPASTVNTTPTLAGLASPASASAAPTDQRPPNPTTPIPFFYDLKPEARSTVYFTLVCKDFWKYERDKVLRSKDIEFNGSKWGATIWPGGRNDFKDGSVTCGLTLVAPDNYSFPTADITKVKFQFSVALPPNDFPRGAIEHSFSEVQRFMAGAFFRRQDVPRDEPDVTIILTLQSCTSPERYSGRPSAPILPRPTELHRDIYPGPTPGVNAALLPPDFSIQFERRTFRVHRFVLVPLSQYFNSIFTSGLDLQENRERFVKMGGDFATSDKEANLLIRWMYGFPMKSLVSRTQASTAHWNLVKLATYWQMEAFVAEITKFHFDNLFSADAFIETYLRAGELGLKEMQELVLKWLRNKGKHIEAKKDHILDQILGNGTEEGMRHLLSAVMDALKDIKPPTA
ncbi:hypothetical protein HDU93_005203 [Gonapodya sp. JEL0774]|nr:hypothetical protein HDU93_005203 [Gonapodya sp. JEL0774]